nr:immunoglobulin heavy chain junction region [Macaca mulatta]MOY21208.1 immunoglobulin heavy chain junction region [Macaca mulatta]MOY21229.1 immunoglobulin heavy chain junction region [Macaca mulatta]MOY21373.1 immunoglobulin heavy chain junction region [Macaca mulatta]MOY21375.1 immunoglobulin heavy chain junction region [Macaca mulatta]
CTTVNRYSGYRDW